MRGPWFIPWTVSREYSPTHCAATTAKRRKTQFMANLLYFPASPLPPPSGVDLTFATHVAASPKSECQIQNSTRNLYLLVVLLILTFVNVAAEMGYEC